MKKRILACTIAAAALSVGVFSGCFQEAVGIQSIDKTNTVGLVDYYTITYTDGTTSSFTVTNGKDGEDANEITAEDVYNTYKSVYNDNEMTFAEFCERYLTVSSTGNAAINSAMLSCMKVYSIFTENVRNDYGRYVNAEACYCGSAVIYKMEQEYTYILTNYHVVYDNNALTSYDADRDKLSDEIYCYMYGSEYAPVHSDANNAYSDYVIAENDTYAIKCDYIGGAITYDVAVVRAKTADILAVNPQAKEIEICYDYCVGEKAYAIGNPNDAGISITEGTVSVDSENITLQIDDKTRSYRSIRTDAALTHGNSGGGLFNADGKLIGLTNSGDEEVVMEVSVPVLGMNYAIPATIVTGVADGVIHYSSLDARLRGTKKVFLGITSVAENSRFVYDESLGYGKIVEDVVVQSVEPEGTTEAQRLAKSLGIKDGDKLTAVSVNGVKHDVCRSFEIGDLLLTIRAGDKLKIFYTRDSVAGETAEHTVVDANLINPDD